MTPNKWLDNFKFLENVEFHDKIYFQILAKEISNYLKNAPIPLVTWWNPEQECIYFILGQNIKWYVKVDTNVSYKDYITQVEKYARKYYPKYKVDTEVQVSLTEDEIVSILQKEKNVSFDDVVKRKKTTIVKEKGIIERVYMMDDEFLLNTDDGNLSLRMSGIPIRNPLSLTEFLEQIKKININEENLSREDIYKKVRNFIFENSIEKRKILKKIQVIEYTGMQMINFFNINFSVLRKHELEKTDDLWYRWDNNEIHFESTLIENECLKIYKEKRNKLITSVCD